MLFRSTMKSSDHINVLVETDAGLAEHKMFLKSMAGGQAAAAEDADKKHTGNTNTQGQQQPATPKEEMKAAIKAKLAEERQQSNTNSNRI